MGVSWISGVVFLVFVFCSSSGAIEEEVKIENVDVHAAQHLLMAKSHRYLDVRTEEEFKKGHVENALNIPYMFNTPQGRVKNPKFMNQVLSAIGKEEKLVVGCKSGVRSAYATKDLLNEEFKHVCNMEGGYDAWVKKGFSVYYPNKTEL